MSKKQKKSCYHEMKRPKAEFNPPHDKTPRVESVPQDYLEPVFLTEQMDMDGPWGWNSFEGSHQPDFLQHLLETQKLTFPVLGDRGSHWVEIYKLIPEARKRLRDIQKDDLDELYSWRITGKKRVWCLREKNQLWLLWWDPKHEVCPSLK